MSIQVSQSLRSPWTCAIVLVLALVTSSAHAGGIIVVPPPQYTFTIGGGVGTVGSNVEVPVEVDVFGAEMYSWNLNVCHDPFGLSLVSVVEGADLVAVNPDFSVINVGVNGWSHAVITNIGWVDFTQCLPVGPDREISRATYTVLQPAATTICFCDAVAGIVPPTPLYADKCSEPPVPVTDVSYECGVIVVTAGLVGFIRGDANRDAVHNLADAIMTIDVLFGGASGFSCPDAADTNDDGLNNLADAIYSLMFFFGGGPVPPPPYSFCGTDFTPDLIGCGDYACP